MSAPAAVLTRSAALQRVAAFAGDHDRRDDGAFPEASWAALRAARIPSATADGPIDPVGELELARAVAQADLSVGRILDGHLNAVQRLRVQVPPHVAEPELELVRAGRLRLGVWGADPAGSEGIPATLSGLAGAVTLTGVKVFCSGAGGLERAFVLVRGPEDPGPSRLAYVDLTGGGVEVDRSWWNGAGMRGSASHRVLFDGARVLWLADAPGALLEDPWFSGDALRTAATWVGGAQAAAADAVRVLREKGADSDLEALGLGRVLSARGTLELWLAEAGRRLASAMAAAPDPAPVEAADALAAPAAGGAAQAVALQPAAGPRSAAEALAAPPAPSGRTAAEALAAPPQADLRAFAAFARLAIDGAVRALLDEAERACGSRPLATGATLERASRDLRTYLLQHRLDPIVARAGRAALQAGP